MSDELSLTPLKKAIVTLRRALDMPKNEDTRDIVVKRFEYSYELSWKTLKRYFKQNRKEIETEDLSIKDLFRQAGRIGLVDNAERWFDYREARNLTAHTYNEEAAQKVVSLMEVFIKDAEQLLANLETRNANPII